MKIRKYRFLSIIAILAILTGCTSVKNFRSDVDTTLKPWTNLNFNNIPDNFQFALISDRNGGGRPGIFEDGIDKLNLMMPEFVINIGDLLPGYTTDTARIARDWNEVDSIISRLKVPFFYVPGNHDITNKVMEKEWEKRFGRRYYNFTYKNVLFVILDTNDDDEYNLTRKQTDFVLNTLNRNKNVHWTFVLMHHPIWTYDTGGRFEEIQAALRGRKHTVIAGHEHSYYHSVQENANYYILATTGGSTSMLGNYFGEFDHVSWITMNDNGPVMVNLKLDGILPDDISNENTQKLAEPLISNSRLNHIILCNKGKTFTNGTFYLAFNNPSDIDMEAELHFFHHPQLQIKLPEPEIELAAGTSKIVEIPFLSANPIEFENLDSLCLEWEIGYDSEIYPGFALQGKTKFPVEPTETKFITNEINTFFDDVEIGFSNPFESLTPIYSINGSAENTFTSAVKISNNAEISFCLKNNREEYSAVESRKFRKTEFLEPATVSNPHPGLHYKYYEGEWENMPDFSNQEIKAEGTAHDFMVRDVAQREDHWALVYSGFIKIEEDNLYIFRTRADDACRFYIDDHVVTDENSLIKGEYVGALALKKGFHTVRIEFLEEEGNQRLRFYKKNREDDDWEFMEFDYFSHH